MHIPLIDLKSQYCSIQGELQEAINRVLESTDYIMGLDVYEFEREFAQYCGAKYCCSVANGTDALIIALKALGLKTGERVLTVANTFIASSECITHAGGIPDFVDVDPISYLIDVQKLEDKIVKLRKQGISVRGIIAVHLYGQPCEMEALSELARKYDLFLIEDCAQAHGAEYKGKRVGTLGDIATFSFYPGKNLGAFGDAGAITTNNRQLAELVEMYRNHGRSQTMKYEHQIEGFNSRLDNLQAAILRVKLKHLETWTAQRIHNANRYRHYLEGLRALILPTKAEHVKHVYHLYVVRTMKRNQLKSVLEENGVKTGIHYPLPLHLQPAYKHLKYSRGDFPQAESLSDQVLSLPMDGEISDTKIQYISNIIIDFFSKNN